MKVRNSVNAEKLKELEQSKLRETMDGIRFQLASQAVTGWHNRVNLSAEQSADLLSTIENEGLIPRYRSGAIEKAVARVAEKLTDTLSADQLRLLSATNRLITVEGLKPGSQYQPVSYAGRKMGRVTDNATILAGLLAEAILKLRHQVRVAGVHSPNDPDHYLSTVVQVKGQESRLNSGSLLDFGFHGDSDGNLVRLIDDIIFVGQIPGILFQPTLYGNTEVVLDAEKDPEVTRHVETLRKPWFVTKKPGFVETVSFAEFARPVLERDATVIIHPTTKPHSRLSQTEAALAELALAWFRRRLTETAIGIELAPFQVAIAPNRIIKHAVWAKTIFQKGGMTDRQFIRLYGTGSVRQPGSRIVTAPMV